MKSTNYFAAVAVLAMSSVGVLSFHSTPAGDARTSRHTIAASTPSLQPAKPELMNAYGKLPLSFEANQGQTDSQVKFLSRGSGYALYLTPTEAVLSLREP